MSDDYFIPADFDNIISQPKPTKEQAIQTRHFGCVPIREILTEKLETPRDKQFKFNPSMRINNA